MKTYILLLSSLLLLASCGSQKAQAPKDTNTSSRSTLTTKSSDGVTAIDPTTVDPSTLTTVSSTGTTERPRN